jgi:hypothetical protein
MITQPHKSARTKNSGTTRLCESVCVWIVSCSSPFDNRHTTLNQTGIGTKQNITVGVGRACPSVQRLAGSPTDRQTFRVRVECTIHAFKLASMCAFARHAWETEAGANRKHAVPATPLLPLVEQEVHTLSLHLAAIAPSLLTRLLLGRSSLAHCRSHPSPPAFLAPLPLGRGSPRDASIVRMMSSNSSTTPCESNGVDKAINQ